MRQAFSKRKQNGRFAYVTAPPHVPSTTTWQPTIAGIGIHGTEEKRRGLFINYFFDLLYAVSCVIKAER